MRIRRARSPGRPRPEDRQNKRRSTDAPRPGSSRDDGPRPAHRLRLHVGVRVIPLALAMARHAGPRVEAGVKSRAGRPNRDGDACLLRRRRGSDADGSTTPRLRRGPGVGATRSVAAQARPLARAAVWQKGQRERSAPRHVRRRAPRVQAPRHQIPADLRNCAWLPPFRRLHSLGLRRGRGRLLRRPPAPRRAAARHGALRPHAVQRGPERPVLVALRLPQLSHPLPVSEDQSGTGVLAATARFSSDHPRGGARKGAAAIRTLRPRSTQGTSTRPASASTSTFCTATRGRSGTTAPRTATAARRSAPWAARCRTRRSRR